MFVVVRVEVIGGGTLVVVFVSVVVITLSGPTIVIYCVLAGGTLVVVCV